MEPWRKNLYVIWGAQFLAMAGMSMAMPFMPFYIRSLGVADLASVKRWSGTLSSYVGIRPIFFLGAGVFFATTLLVAAGMRERKQGMGGRAMAEG
jgi:hypothetical protein